MPVRWQLGACLLTLLVLCNAQRITTVAEGRNEVCTTRECCREQYRRAIPLFNWCVVDVSVAPGGTGCLAEARCPLDRPVCDAARRQCRSLTDDGDTVVSTASVQTSADLGGRPEDECTQDATCQDGLFCNGREVCSKSRGGNKCAPAPDPTPCLETEYCLENASPGEHCVARCSEASACDDHDFCNGAETCANPPLDSSVTVCLPGTPPCTNGLACINETQTCAPVCSDEACNNLCTGAVCNHTSFMCELAGTPLSCPTSQACDPVLGCVECTPETAAVMCDDGDGCTEDTCVNHVCNHTLACPVGQTCIEGVRECQELCDASWCSLCDGNMCEFINNTCVVTGSAPLECRQHEVCDPVFGTCRARSCATDADCPDNGLFCDGLSMCNVLLGQCQVVPPCTGGAGQRTCLEDLRQCNSICTADSDCAFPEASFCDRYRPCDRANDFCLAARPRCNPLNESCDPFNRICVPVEPVPVPSPLSSLVSGHVLAKWVILVWLFTFIFCILIALLIYVSRHKPRDRML